MYQAPSFSAQPQYAHPDENLGAGGYNHTQASFVIPGSKAAERNSRRKKRAIPVLETVPNHLWENPEPVRPPYSTYNGLMTPETPGHYSIPMDIEMESYHHEPGRHNAFPSPPIPRDWPNEYFTHNYCRPPVVPVAGTSMPQPLTPSPLYTPAWHGNPSVPHPSRTLPSQTYSEHRRDPPNSDFASDHIHIPMFTGNPLPHATDNHRLLPAFADAFMDDNEPVLPMEAIPRLRKRRMTKSQAVEAVHNILQEVELTPTLLLLHILSPDTSHPLARDAFFRRTNEDNILRLLRAIFDDEKGSKICKKWMAPYAVDLVCDLVNREMEAAKPLLSMTSAQTTPEFIEQWDINKIMDPIANDITPTWSSVLLAASEPKRSHDEQARSRPTTRNIISSQVHYLRSNNSCKVQIGLGLMASSTGASRNLMNVLQRCGLTTSFPSVATTISALAGFSVEQASKVSTGPHGLAYDNINLKSSIFVEQRPDAMSKVQTGTFSVIYKLPHAQLEHMRLAPMMERLRNAQPLKMRDLRASNTAAASYFSQTTINVVKILLKHVPELADLRSNPLFQNQPRRQLIPGDKTQCYPLCVSTIEEASITGNIRVHDNIYIQQLKRDPKELNTYAIPCLNDQLTNSRIRSAQALRAKDLSPWERREVFMLTFGAFHLLMNLIWALLNIHRGTITEQGSLTYYFNILEKVRLASEKPDFHTLLMALTQIVEGLILNAWGKECGRPSLSDFAKRNPKPEDIISIAQRIIKKYASPTLDIPKSEIPTKSKKPKASNPLASDDDSDPIPPTNAVDSVYTNTILLTRDLLYIIELTDAISKGDFGRVEDILPDIACVFRGAGSNNYSTEILHLIFNLKEVWTPEFANIMRDIMLVNPSGLEGHAMGIDMNIEHLIGYLKALFSAKGIYADWDRLGNISAAVNYLQLIKKRVTRSLGTGYQGSSHRSVPETVLVTRIANRAHELRFQDKILNRGSQSKVRLNLHQVGYRKFETASLATYNKKMEEMKMGRGFEIDEVDEIPAAQFQDIMIDTDGSVVTSVDDEN